MATSTKRIYGPNGEVYESVVGSDGSVTERVIQAQSRRIQGQTQRAQQEAPVLWDTNGKIRQVGGGTYRPRRVEANNSLGRGDRVQLNDGAVSSTPSTGNLARLEQDLQKQAAALTEVARGLGFQTGGGDPNLDTQVAGVKDVLPRRPRDTYFDESSGTLFFWDIETDPAAGTWKPVFQVLQAAFTAPDSGQIDALSATVHVDGAIAINPAGEIYTGERAGNTWTKLVGGVEDLDFVCNSGDGIYPVITYSSYRLEIVSIFTNGDGNYWLTPDAGNILEVGDNLEIEISDVSDIFAATIQLKRL